MGEMILPLVSARYLQVDGPSNAMVVYIQAGLLLMSLTALMFEYCRARRHRAIVGDEEGQILVDNTPIVRAFSSERLNGVGESSYIREERRSSLEEQSRGLASSEDEATIGGVSADGPDSILDMEHIEVALTGTGPGKEPGGVPRPGLLQGKTAVVAPEQQPPQQHHQAQPGDGGNGHVHGGRASSQSHLHGGGATSKPGAPTSRKERMAASHWGTD